MSGGNGAEALADRISTVLAELELVAAGPAGGCTEVRAGGRLVALIGPRSLEVRLDPAVAAAAARTPDVRASTRGTGWVRFTPQALDRFALDRAEAWLRSAHRGALADR